MTGGTPGGSRIRPLPPAEWPDSMRGAVAALRPPDPRHPLPKQGAAQLDEQQLMDLVFTVGAYDVLAMAFRSFGVELDADLLRE